MAQIDHQLQKRLNAVVTGLADSLMNLGRATGEAALAVQDMAIELDENGRKAAECVAAPAIENIKNGG